MFEKFSDLRSEIFQNLWFWYKSKIYTNFGEKSDPDFAKTGAVWRGPAGGQLPGPTLKGFLVKKWRSY